MDKKITTVSELIKRLCDFNKDAEVIFCSEKGECFHEQILDINVACHEYDGPICPPRIIIDID